MFCFRISGLGVGSIKGPEQLQIVSPHNPGTRIDLDSHGPRNPILIIRA